MHQRLQNSSLMCDQLARQLLPGGFNEDSVRFFGVLLRELAAGKPVEEEQLAKLMGWPVDELTATLKRTPGVEYDGDDHIVGYGLTLRETPHALELDGHRLYTWCALDALIFPTLLGKTAKVFSSCAATGAPVRLSVTPEAIRELEPPEAMVSLVCPDALENIRATFCCHVHFFASASVAEAWASTHKQATVVSVEEAFQLGQELVNTLGSIHD